MLNQYSLLIDIKDTPRIEVWPQSGLVTVAGNQIELPVLVASKVNLERIGNSIKVSDQMGFDISCNLLRSLCTFSIRLVDKLGEH